ncbi:MAG: NTP transferase domain-containing protein [Clostridiales bacterium]|jgi:dTDP-glucose pyrophosphorylase|nr:NTP transferase domain-containing protein [Clostridiales bacterium]
MGNVQLVILAAGMGSRYGGMKQSEPIDSEGCFIIDYSIYDALTAGIDDIVIVIKKEMLEDFRGAVGKRVEKKARVTYVFQDMTDLPQGFAIPEGREKPWGTGHAVLSARNAVNKPFIVINADDFYGRSSYTAIAQAAVALKPGECVMAGYTLGRTLSDTGSVKRAICDIGAADRLLHIEEHTNLERSSGAVKGLNIAGEPVILSPAHIVSLNFWCFHNTVFEAMEADFTEFLRSLPKEREKTMEYYLPSFVQDQIDQGQLTASVVPVAARWHGITYREDLVSLISAVEEYKKQGIYPERLWENAN